VSIFISLSYPVIPYVAVNLQITFLGKHFSGEIKFGWELDWRRRW
jgi:hypothetical protein